MNTEYLMTKAFVDGQWLAPKSGDQFSVSDPATGNEITLLSDCGIHETEMAIDAAHNAFPAWSRKSPYERSNFLSKVADLLTKTADKIAPIITLENGKPYKEAFGEVLYSASYFKWFAEEAVRIYGDTIPTRSASSKATATKHPIGVCAAITPWNFPLAMLARKAGAALAAGCTLVAKPAEDTPLSALTLAKIFEEADLPNGVFNVLPASSPVEIGKILTTHPKIKKVSFTGSTDVGRILYTQSAPSLKKLSLELGGNAPFIVFESADLDLAVKGLMQAKFRNAGQTCICANRIFVHKNVRDKFVSKLSEKVSKLKVGNGFSEETMIGPLINSAAMKKVSSLLEDAASKNANIITGGQKSPAGDLFFSPTIISNLNSDMDIAREEIFGPIIPIFEFDAEQEATIAANATDYGLAAYIYTEQLSQAWRVSDALEFGMVGINETQISDAAAPFGGINQSGFGREGSKYGLDDYLEIKYRLFGNLR